GWEIMPVVEEVQRQASRERQHEESNPAAEQDDGGRQTFISAPDFSIRHFVAGTCEFEPHSHSAFTATTVLAGELNANIGGSELIAPAGQTILTGVGEMHSARSQSVEFISFGLRPAAVYETLGKSGFAPSASEVVFKDKVVLDETLLSIARSARSEARDARPGRRQMFEALVGQLLIHLLRTQFSVRKSAAIEMSRAGPVDRRLRRAIEFMHDNYSRELGLEEIAASAYLSEYHFARLFKQVTGMTPGAFLAGIRLERARTLLAQTRKPISEIAAMVGYQSQSHFTKVFRSVTGLTPRAFRESCQPESGTHD